MQKLGLERQEDGTFKIREVQKLGLERQEDGTFKVREIYGSERYQPGQVLTKEQVEFAIQSERWDVVVKRVKTVKPYKFPEFKAVIHDKAEVLTIGMLEAAMIRDKGGETVCK